MLHADKTHQALCQMANQVFSLDQKLAKLEYPSGTARNVRRLRQSLESFGVRYHDPIGEAYDETRTDCEASISGEKSEGLYIIETIKPIVRLDTSDVQQIIQRALVIVAAKS